MERKIAHALTQLGFTATDAKLYVALLKQHPATGYELASRAGVPRSAIYNVLSRLRDQGLVNAVQDKPAKYAPLPPARLFELLQARFTSNLDELQAAVGRLAVAEPEVTLWSIRGYQTMLDQAKALIASSQHSVVASLWRREAKLLSPALRVAGNSDRRVVLFSFNPLPELPGDRFSYDIPETELERYWRHKIILIADHTRVLVGNADESEDNRAIVTDESALVEMALSNLVLDITLFGQRMGRATGDVVAGLSTHLAPVEELVAKTLRGTSA